MIELAILERPILLAEPEICQDTHVHLPAPRFASVPRRLPHDALLLSYVLHVSIYALLPMLFPPVHLVPSRLQMAVVLRPEPEHVPLVLPQLTMSAHAESSSEPGKEAQRQPAERSSIAQYAGPQEVVSDLPNATNTVQTILRPDLVKPPTLPNPIRLPAMVQVPAPEEVHPPRIEFAAAAPEIPVKEAPLLRPAVLVVRSSDRPHVIADVPPPQVHTEGNVPAPDLLPAAGNAPTLAKAAIVINAVEVPPDPRVSLPDAELAGRFAVKSLQPVVSGPAPAAHGKPAVEAGRETERATSTLPSAGAAHTDVVAAKGGGGREGSGVGSGTVSAASGAGSSATSGGGSQGIHITGSGSGTGGLAIAGGGARGGSVHATQPHSYGLTIISAGNSGGPTRDLGVFTRNETVYTVYLPMNDAGGGSDWSLQYALVGISNTTGLISPPYPTKKVGGRLPAGSMSSDAANPVFVVATIDADGQLQSLSAARANDNRSAPAIATLQQWQFVPAKLDGKAVAVKVLVGVMLSPQ